MFVSLGRDVKPLRSLCGSSQRLCSDECCRDCDNNGRVLEKETYKPLGLNFHGLRSSKTITSLRQLVNFSLSTSPNPIRFSLFRTQFNSIHVQDKDKR